MEVLPHSLIMKDDFSHSANFQDTEGNLAVAGSEALELTSAHPDPPPLTLTWLALLSAARTSHTLRDINLPCEQVPEREKLLLVAAAAIPLDNLSLLHAIKLTLYGKKEAEHVSASAVQVAALQVCIVYELEEIAMRVVESVGAEELLPLWIVHRAGEKGMMRFLKCVSDFNVKICCPQAMQRAVFKLKRNTKGVVKGVSHRFQTNSDSLAPEDVLTWAILTGGEAKAREVLDWGLDISDINVGKLLLSEGLTALFDSLVKDLRLPLTPAITVLLLKYQEFPLLNKYIKVMGM